MTQATQDLSPVKQALLTIRRQEERIRALEQAAREPIAIIGMSCRFPGGANHPEAFWDLLAQGRDAIAPVPPDRWDADACYDADPDAPGRMNSRLGGFCADVGHFDAEFFKLSPLEARAMDPQQRLLLELGWEALENANLLPEKLYGSGAGVFIGISTADYYSRQQAQAAPEQIGAYYISGGALSVAAGRLSYLLGLNGPSLSVDTACSSSLTALHLACQSLRDRGCDLALAGGVGLLLTPEPSIAFSKARMLAPDGRCKTFDAAADGYVRGEGGAVLALKRLSDAQADGDRILAVVRGSAANQNGASGGLTVPSGPAQEAVIRQALADAGASPDQVDYVEAHGTGTALGDPIELRALGRVFASASRAAPLMVGSVKTNIGHLEAAAGIAGVVKLVLSLQRGAIPPHLHFDTPTPHFPWSEYPLQVPTKLSQWPRAAAERLAGVSSFGFAGSNAHVLIGAPPAPLAAAEPGQGPQLLALSAKTPQALRELAARYVERLRRDPAIDLAALCHNANRRRSRFPQRLARIAATPLEMAAELAAFIDGQPEHWPDGADALRESAQAWQAGAAVDWDRVDATPRARLDLPTYPFQRERYWYDQAAETSASLLGRRLDSPFLHALFETRLQEGQPSFLGEHRVAGRIVVAGAHFLTMMLEALSARAADDGQPLQLENVQFLRALSLAPGARLKLQLGMAAAGDRYTLGIASADAAGWTTHAAAGAVRGQPEPARDSLAAAQGRCQEEWDAERIYRHAAATGIELGPHFRSIRRLRRGQGEALAQLAGPFQPGLLDGCFQASLAALAELPAHTLVPFGIDKLHWHRRPATARLWCHAKLESGARVGSGRLRCDLRLWDDDGNLCLSFLGFEARAADPASLGAATADARPQTAPWQDWLYRVRWQRQDGTAAAGLPRALPQLERAPIDARIDWPAVEAYGHGLEALNALSRAYAGQALRDLGLAPGAGRPEDGPALGVVPAQQRLFSRLLQISAQASAAPLAADALAAQIEREHPAVARELRVLKRCGLALADTLRGRRDPLELLFPGGDTAELAALYAESAAARCMNLLLSEAVAQTLQAWPENGLVRLLEVGAGTGASTAYLLQKLPAAQGQRRIDYTFSDISPHFAAQARARLDGGAGVALDYRLLDIERDPQEQAFAPHSYDIVVAANVLHATRQLETTLSHARGLLAPGGALLMLEGVAPQNWLDLIFGLSGGWWRFDDFALRPDHPLLSPESWQTLLRRTGFSGVQVLSPDSGRDGPALRQAVILAQAPLHAAEAADAPARWLVLADQGGCGQALAKRLRDGGAQCELAWAGSLPDNAKQDPNAHLLDDADPQALAALVGRLSAQAPLRQVVHLWSLDAPRRLADGDDLAAGCRGALHLVQALIGAGQPTPPALSFAVASAADAPPGVVLPSHAALWGLAKVVALEHPELNCRRLDLGSLPADEAAAALYRELRCEPAAGPAEPEIGYRGGERFAPRLARHRAAIAPLAIDPDAGYLITGAFGGLGLLLAESLVGLGARRLLLLGRKAPADGVRARLAELERQGARLTIRQADVCDRQALADALQELDAAGVPLRGIFHAAGTLDDGLLPAQNWQRMQAAMAPKLQGAWNLHCLSAGRPLDHFVLYSSAASLLGSAGQASHAAANAFLDALALQRRADGLAGLSVSWGAWAEVGAATRVGRGEADNQARWLRQGFATLEPKQAGAALEALLADPAADHVGVLSIDWPRLLRHRPGEALLADFAADSPPAAAPGAAPAPASAPQAAAPSLLQSLQAAGAGQREPLLDAALRAMIAAILGWPSADSVDPRRSFLDLGLDSLTSMELRNRLQSALACALPATLTFDYPSVAELTRHLASLHGSQGHAADAAAPTDDEDLDALLIDLLRNELQ